MIACPAVHAMLLRGSNAMKASRLYPYAATSDTVEDNKKRSKVKEIIVLIKARSFLDELNLEHLTS